MADFHSYHPSIPLLVYTQLNISKMIPENVAIQPYLRIRFLIRRRRLALGNGQYGPPHIFLFVVHQLTGPLRPFKRLYYRFPVQLLLENLEYIGSLFFLVVTGQNKEGRPSDQQPGPFSSSAPPGRTGYYSNPKASLNLQQLRRSRAITVDRVSRSLFPLSFTILNIAYWCVFLNSQEDDVKIPV